MLTSSKGFSIFLQLGSFAFKDADVKNACTESAKSTCARHASPVEYPEIHLSLS